MCHRGIAFHRAGRTEPCEGERLDECLQRHAVLQPQAHGDREVVHQPAERGALFVERDEYLAQGAIVVLAGAQVTTMAADYGLLGIAGPSRRQLPPARAMRGMR